MKQLLIFLALATAPNVFGQRKAFNQFAELHYTGVYGASSSHPLSSGFGGLYSFGITPHFSMEMAGDLAFVKDENEYRYGGSTNYLTTYSGRLQLLNLRASLGTKMGKTSFRVLFGPGYRAVSKAHVTRHYTDQPDKKLSWDCYSGVSLQVGVKLMSQLTDHLSIHLSALFEHSFNEYDPTNPHNGEQDYYIASDHEMLQLNLGVAYRFGEWLSK